MPNTTETDADTRANRIDPVLRDAGWGVPEGSKVNREMICPGRITGGGRVNPLSADYESVVRVDLLPTQPNLKCTLTPVSDLC